MVKSMIMEDKVFEANIKLELAETLVGLLVNMTEGKGISTAQEAMYFASQKETMRDLCHVILDEIEAAKGILTDKKGGAAA